MILVITENRMANWKETSLEVRKKLITTLALPLIILCYLEQTALLLWASGCCFVLFFFVCKWINNIYQAQLRYSVNGKAVPSLWLPQHLLLQSACFLSLSVAPGNFFVRVHCLEENSLMRSHLHTTQATHSPQYRPSFAPASGKGEEGHLAAQVAQPLAG